MTPFKVLTCVVFILSISCSAAPAAGLTFTWDPASANPSLGGTAFTADSMTLASNLFAVVQTNGLTPEHFIQPITSFQQNGNPVAVSGFGTVFGLYFDINGVFSIVGGPHFDSLDVRLMADRNADNGTVSSALTGVGFSNPAGVANDVQLAHGTLIAATLALDPVTGIRRAHFVDTFVPEPNEAGFFVAPGAGVPLRLQIDLTTTPDRFQSLLQPNGTTIQLVNNGAGTAVLVPAPASLGLLAGGIALLALAWRRHSVAPDFRPRERGSPGRARS
jgi:hypothetical protein